MAFYNSALKNGTSTISDLKPLQRHDHERGTALAHDIKTRALPPEFSACDVFYSEPPYPAGIKVFDERAGAKTGDYSEFAEPFCFVWSEIKVPKVLVCGKTLQRFFLDAPDFVTSVSLNGAKVDLCSWGVRLPGGLRNTKICFELGKMFHHVGDPCCGYGVPIKHFISARKTNRFTVSDYDPHCVDAVRRVMAGDI